jgi:predicted kinase
MTQQKGKIIVLKGLPGSGKSTRARELMEDTRVMRVNRDDIRSMLFRQWKGKKEQVVTEIEEAAIVSAVHCGYDIIIDDTNLSPRTCSRWQSLAMEHGVAIMEESFDTSIETCILRDNLRTGKAHVGRAIIENMALQYNLIPPIPKDQKVVIFDIDGTLVDSDERAEWLNACKTCKIRERDHDNSHVFVPGAKNHSMYFKGIDKDKPNIAVIQWAQRCFYGGYYVIIVSGRPADIAGDPTVEQLRRLGVQYEHIFMRPGGNFTDDTLVKQDILDKIVKWIPKEQILFTVDDRPRIIRMWKANGLTCYDVGKGIEF